MDEVLCAPHGRRVFHGNMKDKCSECIREERMALSLASRCNDHVSFAGSGMKLHCAACGEAALKAVGLTPDYYPLMVKPVASQKRGKEGQIVGFIGSQLCFFENDVVPPEIGKPIEVMITRALYHRKEGGYWDYGNVMALLLRPVTDEYVLIPHEGFECSGSMCSTTSSSWMTPQEMDEAGIPLSVAYLPKTRRRFSANTRELVANLTPGRTGIWEASNVNASFDRYAPIPLRPGKVWVKRADLGQGGMVRIEGCARPQDGVYYHGMRK